MQWSKLKQRIQERFSNNLEGRLEIFETRYRMGHNHNQGEIWLSLDKERIFSTSDFVAWQRIQCLRLEGNTYDQSFERVKAEGVSPVDQSNTLLFETLNMSIETMLISPSVLVRGLGIADARCGKRRLQRLQGGIETEHPFVQRIYMERTLSG